MTTNLPRIIAGPWLGEFGHELFCWQGRLRYLRDLGHEVVIIGHPHKKFIYKDAYDKWFDHYASCIVTDCSTGYDLSQQDMDDYSHIISKLNVTTTDIIIGPNKPLATYNVNDTSKSSPSFFEQKFIDYYTPNKPIKSCEILIHARSTDKLSTSIRNWPYTKWKELVAWLKDSGYTVGTIGSLEASTGIPDTDDLRGIPLEQLCNIISNAEVLFSPSSGPAHLASLCKTPHIVWSEPKNQIRYEKDWNPFATEVYGIWTSWNPSVEEVKQCFLTWIKSFENSNNN